MFVFCLSYTKNKGGAPGGGGVGEEKAGTVCEADGVCVRVGLISRDGE